MLWAVACSDEGSKNDGPSAPNATDSATANVDESASTDGGTPVLMADHSSYGPEQSITITFSDAPGNNPLDWIAIYQEDDPPHSGSLNWSYVGGGQTTTTAPTHGVVTLDGTTVHDVTWPMPAGRYRAYYLLDDQYEWTAYTSFEVTCPDSHPGCSDAHIIQGSSSGGHSGCTSNSDCGDCERCELSTGSCLSRLTCT